MLTRFGTDSRKVVQDARQIAGGLQSPTLEAEHLLLAVARRPATPAHRVLVEAGLGYDEIHDALADEFAGSLAAVGVTLAAFDLTATAETGRTPRWGTSAKLALQRSSKLAAVTGHRQ